MALTATNRKLSPWLAAAFCAFLSLITLSSNLWLSVENRSDIGGWAINFLCFLPVCFFIAGKVASQLQQEIRELKMQVAELNGKQAT